MPENKDNDNLLQGAKSREVLAWEYGISTRTLMRRLEKHGIALPPGAILPQDQQRIYEALGPPVVYLPPPRRKDEG